MRRGFWGFLRYWAASVLTSLPYYNRSSRLLDWLLDREERH